MKRLALPAIVIIFTAGLTACGGGSPPKGTIGCSCRLFMDATCEAVEAPKGLDDELLNSCEMSFEPECLAKGGLYEPVLPCPQENRHATCEIELPATGFVRVKVWKSPYWTSADNAEISTECGSLGGEVKYE